MKLTFNASSLTYKLFWHTRPQAPPAARDLPGLLLHAQQSNADGTSSGFDAMDHCSPSTRGIFFNRLGTARLPHESRMTWAGLYSFTRLLLSIMFLFSESTKLNTTEQVMSRHSWKDQATQPKIKYFTQVKARPPTFVAFLTGKAQLSDTDIRFLIKSLKEDFNLGGIPIRIMQRCISTKAASSDSNKNSASKGHI